MRYKKAYGIIVREGLLLHGGYMPLTAKGKKIKKAMTKPKSQGGYGKKKGEEVFYASEKSGKIKGIKKHK